MPEHPAEKLFQNPPEGPGGFSANGCPACGGRVWSPFPNYLHVQTSVDEENTDKRPLLTLVAQACQGCGFLATHAINNEARDMFVQHRPLT